MIGRLQLDQVKEHFVPPLLVGGTYVVVFLVLHQASAFFEIFPNVHSWYPSAGLTLGLLLAFGPAFAVFAVVAQLAVDLWIQPFPAGLGNVLLYSFCSAIVYTIAAYLLGRFVGNSNSDLRCSRAVARFLPASVLTAVALSLVNTLNLLFCGLIGSEHLSRAILDGAVGTAVGILAVTPFLLIDIIPLTESLLHHLGGHPTLRSGFGDIRAGTRPRFELIGGSLLLVSVVLWLLADMGIQDRFLTFALLCLPLIWVALASGLEDVSLAGLILSFGGIGILAFLDHSARQVTELQTLIFSASVIGLLIGSTVTETRLLAQANTYRNAVLGCVSVAVEHLVGGDDWKKGFAQILRRLGDASEASHIYLVENHPGEGGDVLESTPYEWVSPVLSIDEHQLRLLNLLRMHHLNPRTEYLAEGHPLHDRVEDLPQEDRAVLKALGLRSLLVVPILVEQRLWGCLGLDRSIFQGDWSASEVDALSAAGRGLGPVLAQAKADQQFRELAGNIRAVFWTSGPNGQKRNYASPAYEQIWNRRLNELDKSPESWKDAIHREDVSYVEAGLMKKGEFDLEYRLVLPDRSIRWIHDRGFPVRKEGGEVVKIVGIAEDVTAQKQAEEKIRGTTLLLTTLIDNLGSGILVEDDKLRVRHVNQAFCKMFDVPAPKQSLFGADSRLLVPKSKSFAQRIESIRKNRKILLGEELQLGDLTLKRDYVPLSVSEEDQFHLWQYQNISEAKRAEEQILASLKEKEVLLQEIHHRVKNNLQIICSLLSLQSNRISDAEVLQIFADSQNRVKAMALVHERLYKSRDLGRVDFPGYARNLTEHLTRSYRADCGAVQLELEVEPVPMNIDTAIPCGLIINELVSNSLKYAFPNDRGGQISVRLLQEGPSTVRLVVKDDGIGLPAEFDLTNAHTLGLKLVNGLAQQIGGTVLLNNENGTEFNIRFPLNSQSPQERSRNGRSAHTHIDR